MEVNLIEELEDLLSLCKDDERITLKTALSQAKRIRKYDDRETTDLEGLKDTYSLYSSPLVYLDVIGLRTCFTTKPMRYTAT